mgnify:CR=1 FL=1
MKLEDWLYIVLILFYTLFNGEAPFFWNERGGTILLVILVRNPHSMVYLRNFWKEAGGVFFIYVQNYAGGSLEFHFMVQAIPGGLVV